MGNEREMRWPPISSTSSNFSTIASYFAKLMRLGSRRHDFRL